MGGGLGGDVDILLVQFVDDFTHLAKVFAAASQIEAAQSRNLANQVFQNLLADLTTWNKGTDAGDTLQDSGENE